jgi:lysophospholipase L1-like esterase
VGWVVLLALLGAVGCAPADEAGREAGPTGLEAGGDELDELPDPRVPDEPVAPIAPPDPVRYVALGDSIAAGTGATTSYVTAYARWLADETGAEVTVTRATTPGWTTDDLRSALADEDLRAAIADAHVVTVNVGGNDLLGAVRVLATGRCEGADGQACLRQAVDAVTAAWDDLLDELVTITEGETTGLRTMDLYAPRPPGTGSLVLAPLVPYLTAVNDHVVAAAAARDIPVADVHDAFADQQDGPVPGTVASDATGPLLAPDGIHPSDRGHGVIAHELAQLGTGMNAA